MTAIFGDGGDLAGIVAMCRNPSVAGVTTNPSLMRRAGVVDFTAFARSVLDVVGDRPLSLPVFADAFAEMERQALLISRWGANVYVKIPVTDARGRSSVPLIRRLSSSGVRLNVTAVLTVEQVAGVAEALAGGPTAYVSVFAGRIADTGRDPVPLMGEALRTIRPYENVRLLWASPRELLNVVQAEQIGCDAISVTADLLAKLPIIGTDLAAYSLETVRMFQRDASAAGYEVGD